MSSALFSLLTYKIGTTLGKALLKMLLDEYKFLGELAPDLLDMLKDRAEASQANREQGQHAVPIATQIAARMRPLFEAEAHSLPQGEIAAALRELVLTLDAAQISADVLVRCNLDPKRIATHLRDARSDATRTLTQDGAALYARALAEAADALVLVATEISGFGARYAAKDLQQGEDILRYLLALLQRPDAEAARFEQTYCQAVQRSLDKLELFGVRYLDDITRVQPLSAAYVRLRVQEQRAPRGLRADDGDPAQADLALLQSYLAGERTRFAPADAARPELVDTLLARTRRVVIIGKAGSGKTTLARWLAVRAAKRDFAPPLAALNTSTVPFYIRLREQVQEGFPTPEQFPALTAPMIAGTMPHGWAHTPLESGRALVLVDGIDELPNEQRATMLERLAQLVQAYPLARYVITTRPEALHEWPEWGAWVAHEGFIEATLQPMEQEERDAFVDHWHAAYADTLNDAVEQAELRGLADKLKDTLADRAELHELAETPLLCAMICALHHESRQELPASRIRLYNDCVEMMLEKRDAGRKVPAGKNYPRLSLEQKQRLLQGFAHWLLLNGYATCTTDEADEQFARLLPSLPTPDKGQRSVRALMVERTQLLREPVAKQIEFVHKTFLEFLAAQAIVENAHFGMLPKYAGDSAWREVIILAAGLARPREQRNLLMKLVARSVPTASAAKSPKQNEARREVGLLALACLETASKLTPDERRAVVEGLSHIFPPKIYEARIITLAGDFAVPYLRADPQHTEEEAVTCVYALAQIGSAAALDAIVGYTDDERDEVAQVIKNAWDSFDRCEYARRVLAERTTLRINVFSSWDGFAELSALVDLDLSGTEVSDLSPLAALPNLASLILSSTLVSDLSPLAALPNLASLNLSSTLVSDLSPLAALPNLASLNLSSTLVSDLSPLSKLPNLASLNLIGTSISDLSPLAKLPNLASLNLIGTSISDLSPLAKLPSLAKLYLSSTSVSDLSPLANLPNLAELYLSDTSVSDLSPLAHPTQLITVVVDDKARFAKQRLPANITLMSPNEYYEEQRKRREAVQTPRTP